MIAQDIARVIGGLDEYALHESNESQENLFVQDMPNDPDNAIAVYQYGGQSPRQTMGNPFVAEMPRVQVIVRNTMIDVAFADAYRVLTLLHAIKHQTLSGVLYRRVEAVSSPFELGPDEKGRQRVVCNYQVDKEFG